MAGVVTPKRRFELASEYQRKLDEKFNGNINIDLFSYHSNPRDVIYHCKRHDFHGIKSAATLIKSLGCPYCRKEDNIFTDDNYRKNKSLKTFDVFLEKARDKHGSKYSYQREDYVCSRTLMPIYCTVHNSTFMQRPSAHLQGQGCPDCGAIDAAINNRTSQEDFIRQVEQTNKNSLLDFSECVYEHMHAKVKFKCELHGYIHKTANTLIRNEQPCNECNKLAARRDSEAEFISKGTALHEGRYDYSLINGQYINNRTKMPVICTVHNITFYTSRNTHIDRLVGCPECAKMLYGRWNIGCLRKNLDYYANRPACVYLFKISSKTEDYYKVGITVNIVHRISLLEKELEGHSISLLQTYWSNVYQSVVEEKSIHKYLEAFVYKPNIKFGGYTECFKLPPDKVLEVTNQLSMPA